MQFGAPSRSRAVATSASLHHHRRRCALGAPCVGTAVPYALHASLPHACHLHACAAAATTAPRPPAALRRRCCARPLCMKPRLPPPAALHHNRGRRHLPPCITTQRHRSASLHHKRGRRHLLPCITATAAASGFPASPQRLQGALQSRVRHGMPPKFARPAGTRRVIRASSLSAAAASPAGLAIVGRQWSPRTACTD